MRTSAARSKTLIAGVALLSMLPISFSSPAQSAVPPSLRLVAAQHTLTLRESRGRVFLNLGVWIAATGGNFELRVARPDYDSPIAGAQVDSVTKDIFRTLPVDALGDNWDGLKNFSIVTFRNADGRAVASERFGFCVNSFDRARLSDSGPELATYPSWCGASSPFTKGMVLGIDEGWATSAFGDFGAVMQVKPGRYQVTVRVARRYVEAFEIPAEDAKVVLDVTVKPARRRHHAHPAGQTQQQLQGAPTRSVPTVTDPAPDTVPDLVALPTWSMSTRRRGGRDFLGFAVTPWNAGPAPLVVEGFRRPDEDTMDAYQYFYDENDEVVGRAPVGTMEFDRRRGHHHWHFLQFAKFSLVDTSDQEVVRSKKQSFCLVPTDAIDLTVPRADYEGFGGGRFTMCGGESAIWVREVLQAGWGDTYFQSVGGQSFNITNLPNGWYTVRVEVNPTGALFETSTANNVETRLVHLGGRPGKRKVLMSPWHGIDS